MKTPFPYIRFFPSDWLADECLRMVSFAARGLWMDLLCLMAKNERRGYLTVKGGVKGGVIPTLTQIAKMVGSTELELAPIWEELKQSGVCSFDADGVMFCRRLVRDTEAYKQAVTSGKKGGNPNLKRDKGGDNPPVNLNIMASGFLASGLWSLTSELLESGLPEQVKTDLVNARRVSALFGRRPATKWAKGELTAWKAASDLVRETEPDAWRKLEGWYARPSAQAPFRRTDMAALLNNWHAEFTKLGCPVKAVNGHQVAEPARLGQNLTQP